LPIDHETYETTTDEMILYEIKYDKDNRYVTINYINTIREIRRHSRAQTLITKKTNKKV